MGRRVKCQITKEYGDSDTFIKIGRYYFRDQDTYDKEEKRKALRKELTYFICSEFLDYKPGQRFPALLSKKLKELDFYNDEVIFEAFRQKQSDIKFWMNNKQFDGDYGRLSYIFAIISNSIGDIYRTAQRTKRQEKLIEQEVHTDDLEIAGTSVKAKNLADWLN